MTDGKLFIDADPDFMVCVNISPEQVTDAYFADSVADLAQEIGFPLNRLCLELSRDCRDLSAEMLRTFAGPVRALGVQLGIDDFGGGNAWFDALQALGVDYVKFSNEFARHAAEGGAGRSALRYLADIEPHLSCRRLRQGHRERGRGKRALRPAGSRRTGSVLRRLRVLRRGAGSVGSPAELTKMKGTACAVPFVVYFSGASQSVP